jgi:predicted nucleic acid-binding Zn ribbon protein
MQPINSIIRSFVRKIGIEAGLALNNIKRHWPEIVGQPIAAHTCPDTVRNSILTIIVDTPQWMHHLSFYKETILEKLGQYDIAEVRFRVGRLHHKAEVKEQTEVSDLDEEDARYMENTLKHVKDEELKEKFRALITHGLKRGKPKRP